MKPIRILAWTFAFGVARAGAQTAQTDCPMHSGHVPDPKASDAPAQHQHDHAPSPYAGKEGAEIKALSADEVQAYRDGTGMGLAKPAELNHYPGPRHVLDMAEALALTPAQSKELKAIFDRMHADAVSLGERILAEEKALDRGFASGAIDEAKLGEQTRRIASLQAALRAAHLKAHLETKRVLTAAQVARYDALRGYTPTSS